ncbi:hypothetical protein NQD34_003804 [Periophthalmus magnuspinnatus]|nr:hypothetical protein NQD34_003804 [Periophthalmus magnuspinnatus]
MSTSKKKRMGSQRRSLNPNAQESPETSDAAVSPPLPEGRQRADAVVDLSSDSTQSDPPARKKKLSSQRGNKGKLQFKETDVITESSHEPLEEVDDTTTHSQALDSLGIKNASTDETLERNSTEGNGAADESSFAGTLAAISSVPQTSDILDTDVETRSDLPLNDDQNKKYVPKIGSTQEGVLTEMDLAQQMPDILEATLPAGVTGESTYPVRLIEQEDINITASHDHNNKLNAGEEAGHIEKPVCQQSDESSLPTAKIRKLGSSRRRKEVNLKELQDQGHEVAVENNIANALETDDITVVQNTLEVTVDTPPDDAYRGEDQPEMHASQKVKDIEESKAEELLVDFKDQEVKETKPNDEEKVVVPQALSELSFVEIPPTDDSVAPQSTPNPDITVSVQDVEAAKIIETVDSSTQEVFEETDEPTENITIEDSVTSGITGKGDTYSKENNVPFHSDFFTSEEAEKKEPADQEIKDKTLISSSLSSEIPSELDREKSFIAEFITEDETIQLGDPMFGAQMGMRSSTEELLHIDQNDNSDLLNVSASSEADNKNEIYVAQTEEVDQVTSSSGRVTDEDRDDSAEDPTNIKDAFSDYKSVDLIEQQLGNTSTDGVCTIPDQIYKSEDQEEDVKLSDSQSEIVHSDDIIAPSNTSQDNISGEDDDIKTEGFLKTESIATVVQESTKSNTYPNENVIFGFFDSDEGKKEIDEKSFKEQTIESSKGLLSKEMCPEESDMLLLSKDEAVSGPICEQPGIHATTELLYVNESKKINVQNVTAHPENTTDKGVDNNSAGLAELGESTDKLLFSETHSAEDESEGVDNAILEQQPEPLISFQLSTDPKEEDKQLVAGEQLVYLQNDKTSESQEPQIQKTDTDAPLTSPHSEVCANIKNETTAESQLIGNRKKLGSSRRMRGRRQVNDEAKTDEKPVESITPVIFTEEIQIEPTLQEQGQISVMVNEDHEVDKDLSKLVYDESSETAEDLQKEPSSLNVSKGQSVDNKLKQYAEGNYLVLMADDGENQPKELNNSNDNVPVEVSEDQMENKEMIVGLPKEDISYKESVQIPHTDNIKAPLASTHPVVSVGEEDVTQLIESQDNTESKQEKIDITPNESIEITQVESVIETQRQEMTIDGDILVGQTAEGSIKVQDETLEEQIVEDNASKNENIQSNITDSVLEVRSSLTQESIKEPQDTEKNEVETEIYALKEPINVHQLTYISDNEAHEELDSSSLLQAEHPVQGESTGEPSEAVQLVNAPNTDPPLHGPRRKLGSSRRIKARKPELTTANDEPSNESQDIDKVTEFVQPVPTEILPQKELNIPDFASEVKAELTNQSNAKPEDTMFSPSDQEQTVYSEFSNQDKEKNSQESKLLEEIQKGVPAAESSFTIIDLNAKAETGSPHNANIIQGNTRGGSEEMISAKIEDAIQSVVIVAEDKPKDQQEGQDIEVLKTTSEPKRRKMGSTRRSQLNRKQQDEEKSPEHNAAIFDITTAINEKEMIATAKEEDVNIATLSPGKHDQQNEEGAKRQMVAQEDKKEEALQTEKAALIEGINKDAAMQNLQPTANEEIQPSSPGKRRKMGSTRKNLSSKKESPPEETVTPINMEKEAVVSISNENIERKEHSGSHIHAASVHQPPPGEESPLSQQGNQEKLTSESELEVSSHPDVMTEDAAVARRRKMGSHRKPHTDQSIRHVKDSEESPVHPLEQPRAELPQLGQIEANERDNKTFSTASAFSIKGDSRPVGQKIPQASQPSMNVRRAQQSNIRLAAGYDLSVSKYEVVMIGDSSVGKTSFMQRAQSGRFSPDVPASIGMDSYKWTVVVDGKTVVLHLWDTAGQERFHSMTKQIFHRAQAFLLMYDITCAQTFTAVSYWASCIKEGAGENVVILLLGNKSDSKERKVRTVEGELLAQENDFAFLECSAATGENVIEALETVARLLSQKAARREEPLVLRKPEPRNKGCC